MWRYLSLVFVWFMIALLSPASAHAYYTGMPANLVIGQSDLTSNATGPTQLSPTNPQDTLIVGTKFIVADQGGNRVLIWNKVPTQNGIPADVVLGQPDFISSTANNGGRSASTLSAPTSVASDGVKLFVADRANNRILIWNTIPTSNQAAANIVVGQPDFITGSNVCGATRLNVPETVFVYGSRMFIVDAANRRVLIYNSILVANTPTPDIVVGQPDLTTCTINNGGISAKSLSFPHGVFYNGGKLFISDESNNRIQIWNTLPTGNFASADVVIGQADFTGSNGNQGGSVGANTLSAPNNMIISDNRLFVADQSNHRYLIFNTVPTTNNASADVVLGQPDFASITANNGGIAANTANNAVHVYPYGNKLYLTDQSNNRILIFENVFSVPQLSIATPVSLTDGKIKINGSVQLGERGHYSLQRMQANVNGQGFGNVSYLSGGRDNGANNTLYDFNHEFEAWAGNGTKENWNNESGFTINLRASSSNAEEDQIFYFQPFELKSVSGSTLKIKLNKDHWDRIKNNVDSFEIQTKRGNVWTTLEDKIAIDSESIKTTKTLSGEIRVVAKDKWGHKQTTTNSLSLSNFSSYNTNYKTATLGFPLQINRISGVNTGIISTYMSLSKNAFVSSTPKPVFSGIAYAGSTVTVLVTDPVVGRSTTFSTTTKQDSSWSIVPTLFSSSVIDVWVSDTANRYAELPTFKLTQVRSEQ